MSLLLLGSQSKYLRAIAKLLKGYYKPMRHLTNITHQPEGHFVKALSAYSSVQLHCYVQLVLTHGTFCYLTDGSLNLCDLN